MQCFFTAIYEVTIKLKLSKV